MGCWYSTCFMSNLPIMPGDDIAIIVLAPNYPSRKTQLTCNATDRYSPIGAPFFAEYDDDLRIRNLKSVSTHNIRYFKEFANLHEASGRVSIDGKDFISYEKYKIESMEKFLIDVVEGRVYVDRKGFGEDDKAPLEHVMIHASLYEILINNVANRKPVNCEDTYENEIYTKVIKTIEWMKEEDEMLTNLRDEIQVDMLRVRRFSDRVHIDSLSRWSPMDKFAKYYLESENEEILDDIVKYVIWATVMNMSRKGYHCISGAGSQDRELMIHKLIADWVYKKCEEAIESSDDFEGNALEESIYFWRY